MRILNVNATLDPVSGGGTAERTWQMSRYLAKAGAECKVLTLDLGLTREHLNTLAGVEIIALRCLSRRFYLFWPRDHRISEAVRWADVIHLMGHWTLINAVVYGEARRRAKPYVFCPAGALSIFGRSALLKTLYNAVTGRRIARDASACVAIARNESEQFQSYAVGADRLTIIPNGVDPEQFLGDAHAFRSKFGIGDVPFVLFMGRLNPIKGPDLLLRAFADVADVFPDIHLVFAGPDDGILQDLRRMAEESGRGSRVHFLGHVSGADKAGAYRATRLLAIPSRREAMSIVVLEAGICGTPVLMTDQCGFDEIDEAGGGRIVPATVDGLKSGLLEMLSDSARLSRMGQQLENHTRTNFLWEATATRYIELFNRVLRSAATS